MRLSSDMLKNYNIYNKQYSYGSTFKQGLDIRINTRLALIFLITRPPRFQIEFVRLSKHNIRSLVIRNQRQSKTVMSNIICSFATFLGHR